jgi:hypothetical protein
MNRESFGGKMAANLGVRQEYDCIANELLSFRCRHLTQILTINHRLLFLSKTHVENDYPMHIRFRDAHIELDMGSDFFHILQPTFTQGLVLGQISVLLLLGLILKYLFLDTSQPPAARAEIREENGNALTTDEKQRSSESTEWFNTVVQKVCIYCVYLSASS